MNLSTKHIALLFIPALLLLAAGLFFQITRYAPSDPTALLKQAAKADIPNVVPIFSDDPIIGERNGATTLIAFADVACAHCQDEFTMLNDMATRYPKKLKVIWKGLPVTRIPYPSDIANAYAYCANQQKKFVPFVAGIIQSGNDTLTDDVLKGIADSAGLRSADVNNCLASGSAALYQKKVESLAHDLNIQNTPTIFLNNKQIEAPSSADGWQTLLGLE